MAGRDLRGTQKERDFYAAFGNPIKITANAMIKMFSKFYDKETKKEIISYYTDDLITVTENEFPGVKPSTTTIGIYIFNKVITEDLKVVGYVNKVFDKELLGKLDKVVADALLADDITQQQAFNYIDNCQWLLGGKLGHIINPSISENIMRLPSDAAKLKKDLINKNKQKMLVDNDPIVSSQVEMQIVDKAMETLRAADDPSMALFDSGCGAEQYNHYKALFVMKGAIKDNTGLYKSGYKVATSDYNTGVTIEDQAKVADNVVSSSYASGVKTMTAGYQAKKWNAMFQNIKLGPRGSDCKTTDTEDVTITEENKDEWSQYHFHMLDGKPEMLTPKNINKYIGKTLKMRVPDKCKMKNHTYCNVCFGDRSFRLDIINIGMAMNIACGSMLNAGMKTKHDSRVKPYDIDIEKDLLLFAK